MSAVRRKRYYGTDRVRINDVSLEGQELMFIGDCNVHGNRKTAKKYKDHVLLKFVDKKWLRQNKLMHFELHIVPKTSLDRFFIAEEDM
ncbi:MAG: hypothetical protein NWE76_01935 [Candidatus Bathyarchaeota archaeon]|nr:hypothetical protein [Candidatus Bathyarchaeota archaeon]